MPTTEPAPVEKVADSALPQYFLVVNSGLPNGWTRLDEYTGGRDNSQDLYCQGTSKDFGDGRGVASMPVCLMWMPGATFPRHHEHTYTYAKAGTYEAMFGYGPIGPVTVTVEAR